MFRNSPIIAWRNSEQRYELIGSKCLSCNAPYYTKPYFCPCGSSSFDSVAFSGVGTLLSFTQVIIPSVEFATTAPYCIGLIKLAEGPQLIAQLADVDLAELKIGMPVKSVFRRYFSAGDRGMIHYGVKFVPASYP